MKVKLPALPPLRALVAVVVAVLASAAVAWGSQSRFGVAMEVVIAAAFVWAFAVAAFLREGVWLVGQARGRALFEPYGPYRSHATLLPLPLAVALVAGVAANVLATVLQWPVRPRVPALFLAGLFAAVVIGARAGIDRARPQGVFHGPLKGWLVEATALVVVLTSSWNILYFLLRYGPLVRVGGDGFGRHSAALLAGSITAAFSWTFLRAACEQRAGTVAFTDRPGPALVRRAVIVVVALLALVSSLAFTRVPHVGWWPGFVATGLVGVLVTAVAAVAGVVVGAGVVAPNPWRPEEQRR